MRQIVVPHPVLVPGIGGSVGLGGVEVANPLGASHAISTASRGDNAELGRAAGFEVIDPVDGVAVGRRRPADQREGRGSGAQWCRAVAQRHLIEDRPFGRVLLTT